MLTVTKGNAPSQRNLDYRSSMGDGSQMMRIDFAPDGVRLDGIDSKDPDVRCQLDPPGQLYRSEMPVESEWRWSSACEVTLGGTKMTRTITEKVTVVSTGSSTALKREVAFIELRRERINEFRYEGGKNVQAELEVEKYAPDLGVAIERTTKTSPQADRSFSATLKLTLDSFVESTGG